MTNNSLFCCPVCAGSLEKTDKSYKCASGHLFDMAKEGYVNLLTSNKSSDSSGDDKQMVSSRTRFLEGGYYLPLRDKICTLIDETGIDNPILLDAGCGEGYYTSAFISHCEHVTGVDLSKAAVRHASKKCKDAEFAVCSVYHLPIADETVDVIVNCFSPMAEGEFHRVLKKGGYLIYVVPGSRHLWELKSILYDNPYENEEKIEQYEGFEFIKVEKAENLFTLDNTEDIQALFHMTPYTWTTPKDGIDRLKNLEKLSVSADFRVHVFRKA